MRKTFGRLLKEHERGLIYLTFLNDASDRITTNGFNESDLEILIFTVEFLSTDLAEHYTHEENLYPVISRHTGEGIICEIINEHKLIMTLLGELAAYISILQKHSYDDNSASLLKLKVKSVYDLLTAHIKKENNLLFNAAKILLNEKDFNHLYKIRKETV